MARPRSALLTLSLPPPWLQLQVAAGWLLSTLLCLTVIFGAQPILDTTHHAYDQLESSMFIAFHRVAWGVGIAWVILACSWGYGGTCATGVRSGLREGVCTRVIVGSLNL